jgi:hypothetical protein
MKVLERREMERWTAQVKCVGATTPSVSPGCGSLLEIEAADLTQVAVYDTGGSYKGVFAVFTCPCCKLDTDIPVSKLPTWLVAGLKHGKQRGVAMSTWGGRD